MEHRKEIIVKHILTMDLFEANIVTVALTHMMEQQEDVLHDLADGNKDNCKKVIEFCDMTIAYLNE